MSTPTPRPAGLAAVRRALGERLGALTRDLPGDWALQSLERLDDDTVLLDIGPADGPHVRLEWREHGGSERPAFLRGPRYAVSYREGPRAWSLDAPETPADIKRAAGALCRFLAEEVTDLPLARAPRRPLDERDAEVFEAATIRTRVEAALDADHQLVGPWSLDDVYDFGPEEIALGFVAPGDDDGATRLKLRRRDPDRPAAYRTEQLDVLYRVPFGRPRSEARERQLDQLARELALVLEQAEADVRFVPAPRPDRPAGAHAGGPPPAMNLALPAPCGLACSFCAVKEEIEPILDPSADFVEHLREDLRRGAAEGTRTLRVNGLEPLAAPYVWELLDLAREVGFEEMHILSTFLPLADPEVADRLFAALPDRYRLYVPLYGSCPEVHDRIVGLDGAFADLMKAVGHCRERMAADDRQGTLIVTTILTAGNLHDAHAMATLVGPLCRWWEVHLPFPNTSSRRDRYPEISVTMTSALEALYPPGWSALADLPLGEVLPCISLRHQERSGHALVTADRLRRRKLEPSGTYYETIGFTHSLGGGEAVAFTSATVPCPHVKGCALSAACPRKVYAAYAKRHGLDELRPVSRDALLALPDGGELDRMLSAAAPGATHG